MSREEAYSFREQHIDPNWTRSEQYHDAFVQKPDPDLEYALKNTEAKGIPAISVHAGEGKLLAMIAKSIGAKRILEVGTLGGYVFIYTIATSIISSFDSVIRLSCLPRPCLRMERLSLWSSLRRTRR